MPATTDVPDGARRIEELTRKLEASSDPGMVAAARELVQAVMELHAAGLERMLEIVSRAGPAGEAILDGFGRDELAGNLLVLYGLHPLDFETRVRNAIEKVQRHGTVEVLSIHDGVVRVRIRAGSGCGSSAGTLKASVEAALHEAAPDLVRLVVEGAEESGGSGFVPLEKLIGSAGAAPVAMKGAGL